MSFYRKCRFWLLGLACLGGISEAAARNSGKAFAYVGSNLIITAEVGSSHSFILNFINLSDYVIVVQPNDLIYKGVSGRFYIGQVFEKEHKDSRGESLKYSASVLLKGHTFTGLTVIGSFQELDQIEQLSLRIGSKRFYLQAVDPLQFEPQDHRKAGDSTYGGSPEGEQLRKSETPGTGQQKRWSSGYQDPARSGPRAR